MRRNEQDLASQPVRNTITNPAMVTKASGTDTLLTNYIANPTFEYATHNTGGIGGSQASFTSSGIVTDKAHSGTKSFKRATCTVAGQASLKPLTNPLTSMKVNKGQKISWSFWIYSTVAGNISPYWEGAKVPDGSYTGGGSAQVAIEANAWTYVTGTSTLAFDAYVHGAGGYGLAVNVGDSVWFDDFCLTQTDSPVEYFNGDTPAENGYTYAWTGTPHYSASIRRASATIVRTNLVANPTFKGGTLTTLRTNSLTNPSFESATGTIDLWTNNATNPSFKTASVTPLEIRRNLAANPSFEATSGTPTVRTNLIAYPNFETTGSVQSIRTNLCLNPRGVNAFVDYSGASNQTITGNVAITGHPEGITTANRVEYTTGANPGVTLLNPVVSGTQYTISAWVYHETIAATSGTQGFAQAGIASMTPPAMVQGVWTRYSWTHTASGTSQLGFRVSSQSGTGSFLITGVLVETRPDLGKFFDGATPVQQNLTPNPSFATNTTGYTTIGATLTRVTNQGGDGHAGELTQTGNPGTRQGVVYIHGSQLEANTYTVSFDFKGTAPEFTNVRAFLYDSGTATTVSAAPTTVLNKDGNFNRYTYTLTASAPFDRIYMEALGVAIPLGTKTWIDRIQIERTATASSFYYEGTGDFSYGWSGTANASSSVQQATIFWGWAYLGAGIYRTIMDPKMGTYSGAIATLGKNGDGIWANLQDVAAGKTYTYSAWVKATSSHALTAAFRWYDSGMAQIGSDTNVVVTSQLVVGSWALVSATATSPANAAKLQTMLRIYETHTPTTFYIDGAICAESMTPVPYFDGSTAASGDFTYAWTGTANASTSIQRGIGVNDAPVLNTVAVSSTEWKIGGSGSKSLRLIPFFTQNNDTFCAISGDTGAIRLGMQAGRTYTVSATIRLAAPLTGTLSARSRKLVFFHKSPADQFHIETPSAQAANVAGETRLSVTVTIPDTATEAFVRLYNGAYAGHGDVWWDNLLVEESTALRPYFDGTTPAHENLVKTPATAAGSVTHTTGVSYNGSTWTRATTPAGGTYSLTRQYVDLASLRIGEVYTSSVTVANDHPTASVTIAHDWNDSGSQSFVIAPGEERRIKVSAVRSAGYSDIFRFADLHVTQHATESRSILFKDWLIELGTTTGDYYTGTGDFTYAWTGTANQSASLQRATFINGTAAGRSSATGFIDSRHFVYQGTDSTGKKMARWLSPYGTPNSNWRTINLNNQSFNWASIVAGQTYTLIMKYRSSGWGAGQTFTVAMKDATAANPVIGDDTARALNTGWTEYRRTFTALINGLSTTCLFIALPITPQATTDGIFDISEWALVPGNYTGPFFDGSSTPASTDFTHVWNGTADASTSKVTAAFPSSTNNNTGRLAWQSNDGPVAGKKSVAVVAGVPNVDTFAEFSPVPFSGQTLGGRTFTIIATRKTMESYPASGNDGRAWRPLWQATKSGGGYQMVQPPIGPTTAGVHQFKYTFTFDADVTTSAFFRLYNGSSTAGSVVWWDDVAVIEGAYTGDYFDGSTAASSDFSYAWSGTANTSTSYQRGMSLPHYAIETKLTTYVTSSGTLIAQVKEPSGAGGRSLVPMSAPGVNLQLTEGKQYSVKMRGRKLNSDTGYRLSGVTSQEIPLTTSMSTMLMTFTANSTPILYIQHPQNSNDAGTEWEYFGVYEGGDPLVYFDGDTSGFDGLTHRWAGTPYASQSQQIGAGVSGFSTESLVRRWALPDGSMRSVNISGVPNSLVTSVGSTTLGRTHTVLFRAKSYGSLTTMKIYGLNNAPSFTLTSSYAWYRATGVATGDRLWLSTESAPAGSGFDISHFMVVEGTYTGGYVDGKSYGARWDGAANASTSLGFPTSLESIAGKPLFTATTTGNTALSSSAVSETSARTIYSIVDNISDVPIAGQAIALSYGITTLNDTVPNKYIIMRQQGSYGQINSLLTRRTGGGGAIIHSLPSSGRHILIGGINENGYLFSGFDNSALVVDNLQMTLPHERVIIEANSAYHNHVITYIYAGFHNDAMRAEMIRLLSMKHNVPL